MFGSNMEFSSDISLKGEHCITSKKTCIMGKYITSSYINSVCSQVSISSLSLPWLKVRLEYLTPIHVLDEQLHSEVSLFPYASALNPKNLLIKQMNITYLSACTERV